MAGHRPDSWGDWTCWLTCMSQITYLSKPLLLPLLREKCSGSPECSALEAGIE